MSYIGNNDNPLPPVFPSSPANDPGNLPDTPQALSGTPPAYMFGKRMLTRVLTASSHAELIAKILIAKISPENALKPNAQLMFKAQCAEALFDTVYHHRGPAGGSISAFSAFSLLNTILQCAKPGALAVIDARISSSSVHSTTLELAIGSETFSYSLPNLPIASNTHERAYFSNLEALISDLEPRQASGNDAGTVLQPAASDEYARSESFSSFPTLSDIAYDPSISSEDEPPPPPPPVTHVELGRRIHAAWLIPESLSQSLPSFAIWLGKVSCDERYAALQHVYSSAEHEILERRPRLPNVEHVRFLASLDGIFIDNDFHATPLLRRLSVSPLATCWE